MVGDAERQRDRGRSEWIGPYEVIEVIGAGGMGRVHLCRDAAGLLVAVKSLHAEPARDAAFRRRFAREVRAARSVGGTYAVPVLDADPDGDVPWMATAYIPAPSLSSLVSRAGALPLAGVRRIGAGVARALVAIHAAGLVHRDVKPGNVLVAHDGPRVIDFGIACAEGQTLTQGALSGTPAYMSPEQIEAPGTVGPASDVFSFGSVLAYAATGRAPWDGGEAYAVLHRITSGEPDLTGLPAELRDVVTACLRRDPAERPAPAELIARLEAVAPAAQGAGWLPEEARTVVLDHTLPPADRPRRTHAVHAHRAELDALHADLALLEREADGGADPAAARDRCAATAERAAALLGEDHPDVCAARAVEARLVGAAGDPARAAHLLGRLVERASRLFGENAPAVLGYRRHLAEWTARSGDAARGLLDAEDVVARCTEVLGADAPATLAARRLRARLLSSLRDRKSVV